MRNKFFTLIALLFLYNAASAQYCGNSGFAVCDTPTTLTKPGFSPVTDSLEPMVNGVLSTTVINFQNYDSVPLLGRMTSLKIDTIDNLPEGICWSMNSASNTFGNKQNGCIKLSGTPCDSAGQYKIRIKATINGFYKLDLESNGLRYYVRVINSGDNATAVDTSKKEPFISFGGAAATGCTPASINNEPETATVSSLVIGPNPMSNRAEVHFTATKSVEMTERISNMLGGIVSKATRDVKPGSNVFSINRNGLPAGVYFYSLSEGRNVITKRMIITD